MLNTCSSKTPSIQKDGQPGIIITWPLDQYLSHQRNYPWWWISVFTAVKVTFGETLGSIWHWRYSDCITFKPRKSISIILYWECKSLNFNFCWISEDFLWDYFMNFDPFTNFNCNSKKAFKVTLEFKLETKQNVLLLNCLFRPELGPTLFFYINRSKMLW